MNDAQDDLDERLAQSAPRDVVVTSAVEDELARMTVLPRADRGRTSAARRHLSRAATIGISSVIVLATAGAAAAAVTFGPWDSYWAKDPVAIYKYTLPSGDMCERRVGAITVEGDDSTAEVEKVLATPGLFDDLDIDAAIQELRAETDATQTLIDGTEIDVSYGTPGYFTPDEEYQQAVTRALISELMSELADSGLAVFTYEGETNCIPGEQ